MRNQDTWAAWTYHDGTKHPDGNLLDAVHAYHGSMRPLLFKVYAELPATPLPLVPTPAGSPLLTQLQSVMRRQTTGTALPPDSCSNVYTLFADS